MLLMKDQDTFSIQAFKQLRELVIEPSNGTSHRRCSAAFAIIRPNTTQLEGAKNVALTSVGSVFVDTMKQDADGIPMKKMYYFQMEP